MIVQIIIFLFKIIVLLFLVWYNLTYELEGNFDCQMNFLNSNIDMNESLRLIRKKKVRYTNHTCKIIIKFSWLVIWKEKKNEIFEISAKYLLLSSTRGAVFFISFRLQFIILFQQQVGEDFSGCSGTGMFLFL